PVATPEIASHSSRFSTSTGSASRRPTPTGSSVIEIRSRSSLQPRTRSPTRRPSASSAGIPMILAAPRFHSMTRSSRSTWTTPSPTWASTDAASARSCTCAYSWARSSACPHCAASATSSRRSPGSNTRGSRKLRTIAPVERPVRGGHRGGRLEPERALVEHGVRRRPAPLERRGDVLGLEARLVADGGEPPQLPPFLVDDRDPARGGAERRRSLADDGPRDPGRRQRSRERLGDGLQPFGCVPGALLRLVQEAVVGG